MNSSFITYWILSHDFTVLMSSEWNPKEKNSTKCHVEGQKMLSAKAPLDNEKITSCPTTLYKLEAFVGNTLQTSVNALRWRAWLCGGSQNNIHIHSENKGHHWVSVMPSSWSGMPAGPREGTLQEEDVKGTREPQWSCLQSLNQVVFRGIKCCAMLHMCWVSSM